MDPGEGASRGNFPGAGTFWHSVPAHEGVFIKLLNFAKESPALQAYPRDTAGSVLTTKANIAIK